MNNRADNKTQLAGTLELLEERAKVITDRIVAGKVSIHKNIRTRTVNVPVELHEEYLTVQVSHGDEAAQAFLADDYEDKDVIARFDESTGGTVTINGKPLQVGDSVEIVLSREVAIVTKRTHAVEEVALHTYSDTKTHTLATELRREELAVDGEQFLDRPL